MATNIRVLLCYKIDGRVERERLIKLRNKEEPIWRSPSKYAHLFMQCYHGEGSQKPPEHICTNAPNFEPTEGKKFKSRFVKYYKIIYNASTLSSRLTYPTFKIRSLFKDDKVVGNSSIQLSKTFKISRLTKFAMAGGKVVNLLCARVSLVICSKDTEKKIYIHT